MELRFLLNQKTASPIGQLISFSLAETFRRDLSSRSLRELPRRRSKTSSVSVKVSTRSRSLKSHSIHRSSQAFERTEVIRSLGCRQEPRPGWRQIIFTPKTNHFRLRTRSRRTGWMNDSTVGVALEISTSGGGSCKWGSMGGF